MKQSCTLVTLRDALLNDSEVAISSSLMDALKNHDVQPISWSKQVEPCEELAA